MVLSTNGRARRRGVTFIEVLIVLGVIMAILALVLPRMLGTQKQADIDTATKQIEAFRQCLQRYALDMKQLPTTEQGLAALVECPADVVEAAAGRWKGPYIEGDALLKDPWGNDYQYEYPPSHGNGDYPDIWSWGPDSEDGTEDDICSWTSGTGSATSAGSAAASTTKPAAPAAKTPNVTTPKSNPPKSTTVRSPK